MTYIRMYYHFFVYLMSIAAAVSSLTLETENFIIDYYIDGNHKIGVVTDLDNNGKYDYVDSVALYANEALSILRDSLQFPKPRPNDKITGKYHINFRDLSNSDSSGISKGGYTAHYADSSSEIFIENDFLISEHDTTYSYFKLNDKWQRVNCVINPFPKLRTTIFHELFHASQGLYLRDFKCPLLESSAVWFQNRWSPNGGAEFGNEFFSNIEHGWFSPDTIDTYSNFPYLDYICKVVGNNFIKSIHQYRSINKPEIPGNILQESSVLANYCTQNNISLKDIVGGYAGQIVGILNGKDVSTLKGLQEFYSNFLPKLPEQKINFRYAFNGVGNADPLGMAIREITIVGYTPQECTLTVELPSPQAWGYIVPVFQTDTGKNVLHPFYISKDKPLHLNLINNTKQVYLYLQSGIQSMICKIAYTLSKSAPPMADPIEFLASGELDSIHSLSKAFDGDLGTGWLPSIGSTNLWIGMDFGKVVPIQRIALYWKLKLQNAVAFTMPFKLYYSTDGSNYRLFHTDAGLGGVNMISTDFEARFVRLIFSGPTINLSNELLEFCALMKTDAVNNNQHVSRYSQEVPNVTFRNRHLFLSQPHNFTKAYIFNANGTKMAEYSLGNTNFISPDLLPSGAYIIRLDQGNAHTTMKLLNP